MCHREVSPQRQRGGLPNTPLGRRRVAVTTIRPIRTVSSGKTDEALAPQVRVVPCLVALGFRPGDLPVASLLGLPCPDFAPTIASLVRTAARRVSSTISTPGRTRETAIPDRFRTLSSPATSVTTRSRSLRKNRHRFSARPREVGPARTTDESCLLPEASADGSRPRRWSGSYDR